MQRRLAQHLPKPAERGLNLGTGEGDYDAMIAAHCGSLVACDVNEADLAHARSLNRMVPNLRYEPNNALALSYPDGHFDLLVSCEVLEHVGQPAQMIREMARVLRPGGIAIMTFPSREFPFSYDPINRLAQWLRPGLAHTRQQWIQQGAYAFGHDYLIDSQAFKQWAKDAGFEVLEFRGLSHHLVGLLEMYWTGLAQRIFKKNTGNADADSAGMLKVRPASTQMPALVIVTDSILALDRWLFGWSERSVGKGVVMRRSG